MRGLEINLVAPEYTGDVELVVSTALLNISMILPEISYFLPRSDLTEPLAISREVATSQSL